METFNIIGGVAGAFFGSSNQQISSNYEEGRLTRYAKTSFTIWTFCLAMLDLMLSPLTKLLKRLIKFKR